ncbi:MAG: LPS assembly lipoprotein LptE [Acidobacteriota bacterium]|nr:LPS assembly lipoprotein LptE [Acidobacteriota bacterium]MDH3522821.1 LPS assembly lipoprotein LptE [Acidobacteriota bacterium]
MRGDTRGVQRISRIARSLAVLALAAAAGGCGYGLVGRTSSLPPDIINIYVSPLENKTLRQQVDLILTQAIGEEFLRRPRFKLVNNALEADAVLRGSINGFHVRPVLFGAAEGRASEYEIVVTASMDFRRTDNDEVLWEQPYYSFSEQYEFDETELIDLEDIAIESVSQDFAQTIVIDLLEGF